MMNAGTRTFAALLEHEGVYLLEYRDEPAGMRIVGYSSDPRRADTIDEALARLRTLLDGRRAVRASLSIVIQHFGVFHHVMALPGASDDVLHAIICREAHRLFGMADPEVSFVRGALVERRDAGRADPETAPRRVFIGGGPAETIASLRAALTRSRLRVEGVTVVPEAIRRVFDSAARSSDPTAVLVCLAGGPHLSFFVDGQMELAIEPPIALEGEYSTDPRAIVDQVERGAVFLRQQSRGAQAAELLLAAPPASYSAIATAIEARTNLRVRPFAHDLPSPEAVVAFGAVLSARAKPSIDLFPHRPSLKLRVRTALRGPRGIATVAAAAAMLATAWLGLQYWNVQSSQRDVTALHASIARDLPALAPAREIASHRETYAQAVAAIRDSRAERARFTTALASVANAAPPGLLFDSLATSRTEKGWTGMIMGRVSGRSTADGMRTLDAFFTAVRHQSGIAQVDLDQFDYQRPALADSTPRVFAAPVTLVFRMMLVFPASPGAQ